MRERQEMCAVPRAPLTGGNLSSRPMTSTMIRVPGRSAHCARSKPRSGIRESPTIQPINSLNVPSTSLIGVNAEAGKLVDREDI